MEQAVLVCTGICASTAVLLWAAVTFYRRGVKAWDKAHKNWAAASSCLEGATKARNEADDLLARAEALRDSLPKAKILSFPRLVTVEPKGAA